MKFKSNIPKKKSSPKKCICGKQKAFCRIHGGNALCPCGKQKATCTKCKGSQICPCGIQKRYCKTCKGSALCPCGKRKDACKKCKHIVKLIHSKQWCNICGQTQVDGITRTICASCDMTTKTRIEYIVCDMLKKHLPTPQISLENKSATAGITKQDRVSCAINSKRLPDMLWEFTDRVLCIEIDEDSHCEREVSCELAKVDDVKWGTLGGLQPLIVLRFNPSAFDKHQISMKSRVERLVERFYFHKTNPIKNYALNQGNVEFLFYHSKSQKHIDAAEKSLNVVGII